MNSASHISRLLDLNRRGLQATNPEDRALTRFEWKEAGGRKLLRGRRVGEAKPKRKKPWKRKYPRKKSKPLSAVEIPERQHSWDRKDETIT